MSHHTTGQTTADLLEASFSQAGGEVIAAVGAVLEQLRTVVESLGPDQYTKVPLEALGGSVGGHVRHCLDHIAAATKAADSAVVDYESRRRGTPIESDPDAALQEINRLQQGLSDVTGRDLHRAVSVRTLLSADGEVSRLGSTLGRELADVFAHTIHHQAMIGAMVKTLGLTVPDGFGLAPSTAAYRKR